MARSETIIGLDLGRYAVKAVWAERAGGGKATLLRAESLRMPPGVADKGAILGPWLAKHGIERKPCAIGLSGQQTMFQPFVLPPGDPRTDEQAAAVEVLRFNELASENMAYGYLPFVTNPGERRLMIAMLRQSLLDEALRSARGLGLDVADMTPGPAALVNCLEWMSGPREAPRLYVNIGQSGTEVAAGTPSALLFARGFASGGQGFTDAVARARRCSAAQAEQVKVAHGSLAGGDPDTAGALRTAAAAWTNELKACLSVYERLYADRRLAISGIVLAGGGAALPGLPEFVAETLGKETTLMPALPFKSAVDKPHEYALAAGLALSALGAGATSLSLLPREVRNELVFRREKPYWVAAACTGALILGVSLAGGYRDYRRMETVLQARKRSLSVRQGLVDQIEAVKASSEHLRGMARPVRDLVEGGPLLREVISLVARSKAPEDRITLICDGESYFTADPLAPPPADPRLSRGAAGRRSTPTGERGAVTRIESVIVEGITRTPNLLTVKQLISRLAKAEFVASADLLSDDRVVSDPTGTNPAGVAGQRFVIDVRLKRT